MSLIRSTIISVIACLSVSCTSNSFNRVEFTSLVSENNTIDVPLVSTPGVVTALVAFSDVDESLNQANGGTPLRTVAQTLVRYASPIQNPKILLIREASLETEVDSDAEFIANEYLYNFDVTLITEPDTGLSLDDIKAYDLVWFNSPSHPIRSEHTYQTLLQYKGGLILSGDDMSWSYEFETTDLTGLTNINNGTSVSCTSGLVAHNGDKNEKYVVSFTQSILDELRVDSVSFEYGRDIDLSVASSQLEVIATAKSKKSDCGDAERPVIVRKPRS